MNKPIIMMADDEPMMQMLLKRLFKDEFEVQMFQNGKEALSWLYGGNIPDLAIIDLQMPEMSGFELLEHCKASGYFKDIPFIILSAEETSSDRIKCLELGASDYVVKPFNPKELELRAKRTLKECQ